MDLERCSSLSRDRGETCPKWTQVQNQCSYAVPVTMARATYTLSALLSGDTVAKPREQKMAACSKLWTQPKFTLCLSAACYLCSHGLSPSSCNRKEAMKQEDEEKAVSSDVLN